MQVKLALPKGQLQESTAELLAKAGCGISDYRDGSRSYRLQCKVFPGLFIKVFHEKDIAIQVAIGNYDLGICRLDWVEELLVKYHSDAVVKVGDLGYGKRSLYVVAAGTPGDHSLESLRNSSDDLRIVSEYPNLAESFALKQRLRRFRIFPVWGAADRYPPENAEIAIIAESSLDRVRERGLSPVATLFESSAHLIANRNSLERKDLGQLLSLLFSVKIEDSSVEESQGAGSEAGVRYSGAGETLVSLALPDGHQQQHTVDLLDRAGLKIEGYNAGAPTRWPRTSIEGIMVKVIRPQDMPFQVANGNFDLAITGKDWLCDHRFRFPSSPVEELLDLGFGKVRIVAVVSSDLPVSSIDDLKKMKWDSVLRVASEYVNIADKYTHDNHLAPCKIMPTWGASEAFLPEDADILIENTETGSTISKHNLKIVDTLFESSGCLIGNTEAMSCTDKKEKIDYLVERLRLGVEGVPVS
ncbi:MAG: ATP phosphoribosyltransferase [Dehalococcoidia bacterium]